MFEGVHTALITPFKDGEIDYASMERIIEEQIAAGVNGLVPMGTTGESPTVSHEEHLDVVRFVVNKVAGRVKVIGGSGSNSTREAVYLSREAEKIGVDGLLLVNPYYNRPPQRALVEHFCEIARSVETPVVLYNIPGRTGVNFLPEFVAEVCEKSPNVKAIKEASGDITQMMRLRELCGDRLEIVSGDDNLLLPILAIGGVGVISVLSNILPADVKKVITLFNEGKLDQSRELFYRLLPLCRAMFLETNPIPIKAAMHMKGMCSSEVRMPLMPLPDELCARLRKSFAEYGVTL